jgi:putative transposase
MPRRDILFLPDQYYHFYNRGNNRQAVFFERDNYLYFLRGLKRYLQQHVEILAYCLMPTHYHILVRVRAAQQAQASDQTQNSEVLKTSEFLDEEFLDEEVSGEEVSGEVSLAMQKFGISYTKAINKRFDRVGALFQGQFKGKLVQHTSHLLNLCLYIHTNPVKDGLVFLPEDWEFSNYLEWINLREGTLVNREFIHNTFGTPEEYKRLVMDTIKNRDLPDDVRKYLQELEG